MSVDDVDPAGYNVLATPITAVTQNTISFALASDPGPYVRGGIAQSAHETLEVATLPKYSAQFTDLDKLLHPSGVLFFMCCMTGQLAAGTRFLTEVSKLLPGRQVMAIATIGFSGGSGQIRQGKNCDEPGMRDSAEISPVPPNLEFQRFGKIWADMTALPWASSASPHTKIAKDGAIVGGAGSAM